MIWTCQCGAAFSPTDDQCAHLVAGRAIWCNPVCRRRHEQKRRTARVKKARHTIDPRQCACGESWTPTVNQNTRALRGQEIFCSVRCRSRAKKQRLRDAEIRRLGTVYTHAECGVCQTVFELTPQRRARLREGKSVYCGPECAKYANLQHALINHKANRVQHARLLNIGKDGVPCDHCGIIFTPNGRQLSHKAKGHSVFCRERCKRRAESKRRYQRGKTKCE